MVDCERTIADDIHNRGAKTLLVIKYKSPAVMAEYTAESIAILPYSVPKLNILITN